MPEPNQVNVVIIYFKVDSDLYTVQSRYVI